MDELDGHLGRTKEVWRRWTNHGVTPETALAVDFHFYAAKSGRAQALTQVLNEAGFVVKTTKERTLLVFEGTHIEATETRAWTLAAIEERVRDLFELATRAGVSFEGFGAEMPE